MKRLLHPMLAITLLLGAMSAVSARATAETFQDGMRAYLAQDFGRAYDCWRPLAEDGDAAEAQYGMGQLFERGDGVQPNVRTAAAWYLRAANQGHTHAQLAVALMYETGRGVPRNARFAAAWYAKAAKAGNPQAQYGLGRLLLRGQIEDEGIAWLERAAAQGYQRAIDDLAVSPSAKIAAPPRRAASLETAASDGVVSAGGETALPMSVVVVRLGSYPTRAEAEDAWRALSGRFSRQLSRLNPSYIAAPIGEITFIRLDAGPLNIEAVALDVCAALRAADQYCFPLRR